MTQLESALKGIVTPSMQRVAERENQSPDFIRQEVARGRLVIPANVRHLAGSGGHAPTEAIGTVPTVGRPVTGHPGARADAKLWVNQTSEQRRLDLESDTRPAGEQSPNRLDPLGIGRMVTTKINANIGASPVSSSTDEEVEKLRWAERFGADTLMDLSTGGNLADCRQAIVDHSTIPIGTVPIYGMIMDRSIEEL